jgi:hypothetical protein
MVISTILWGTINPQPVVLQLWIKHYLLSDELPTSRVPGVKHESIVTSVKARHSRVTASPSACVTSVRNVPISRDMSRFLFSGILFARSLIGRKTSSSLTLTEPPPTV